MTGPDSIAVARTALASSPVDTAIGQQATSNSAWLSRRAVRFTEAIDLPRLGQIDIEVFVWPDSRSYTGQPSVEIHCLGNVVILESIQSRLIECGAILAQPGEFTLRAFLAGRLDLTQCEAVLGVIHASNERSLDVALSQLAGGVSGPLGELRNSLITLLADLEAGLDFVDEDIEFISRSEILNRLERAHQITTSLLHQMESRSGQTFVLQVAIVGAPNAGKSSLVNALVAKQVSIVNTEPGTTRDYVRSRLDLDGILVDLLDTAGIENADPSTPRGLAQHFTHQILEQADLILVCQSGSEIQSADFQQVVEPEKSDLKSVEKTEIWRVETKCDLAGSSDRSPSLALGSSRAYARCLMTSVFQPSSIGVLLDALRQWAHNRQAGDAQVVPLTAARCVVSLRAASNSIQLAEDAACRSIGDEIVASEIRLALDEIGVVAGTVYTDDILDALFSRFCIGK